MGQKINQSSFRVGYKKNTWDSRYNEINFLNISNSLYQEISINKTINIFFNFYKSMSNDVKLNTSEDTLTITLKYYTLQNSEEFVVVLINKIAREKREWFIRYLKKNVFKYYLFVIKKLSLLLHSYINKKRLCFIVAKSSEGSFCHTLSTEYQVKSYKKLKVQFRKYRNTPFFKECFNILISLMKIKNSSELLSNYLSQQFSRLKRHNYFLNFLKRALILILYSPISRIKGVKILLKGRFNGRPRSSHKLIQIGKVSSQTFDSVISYHNSTAFSIFGTFGIKVWVCEK